MNFKVGQEIVCVNDKKLVKVDFLPGPNLVKGSQYSVLATRFCATCGGQNVDVGLRKNESWRTWCICNGIIDFSPISWCASSRFVPLEEWRQSEEAVKELLQPIEEAVA